MIINNSDDFVLEILEFHKYTKDKLRKLLLKNKLLVLRNANLDFAGFDSFSNYFGVPEVAYPYKYQALGFETIRLQSNVEGKGMNGGGMYWHSDGPQTKEPSRITLLSCEEAPLVGGETVFCNLSQAYSDIPEDMKLRIEHLEGNYPCRQIYVDDLIEMGLEPETEIVNSLHNLKHPLVKIHPISGIKALYLNENWLKGLDGIPKEESDELLKYLYDFATEKKYLYYHKWEKNDLLIWDNYSLMHKALDLDSQYPKTTRRIRIKG
ncbi:TauD/TfdA dioxygenase family protein [Polaribacter sp.]|uniref:TauD/TfdA dioxygenase family protein n=1 Tax=Polaribacter sp. TaxID=1920175 RepID=UPI003EF651CE